MALTCYHCQSRRIVADDDSASRFHCQDCGAVFEVRVAGAADNPLPSDGASEGTADAAAFSGDQPRSATDIAESGQPAGEFDQSSSAHSHFEKSRFQHPVAPTRNDETHLSLFAGISGLMASLLCSCAAPVLMAINLAAFFWAWRSTGPVRGAAMWVNAAAIGLEAFLIWWSYF